MSIDLTSARFEETTAEKLSAGEGMAALRIHSADPAAHQLCGMMLGHVARYENTLENYSASIVAGNHGIHRRKHPDSGAQILQQP